MTVAYFTITIVHTTKIRIRKIKSKKDVGKINIAVAQCVVSMQ